MDYVIRDESGQKGKETGQRVPDEDNERPPPANPHPHIAPRGTLLNGHGLL